jgi:hypothetical protein
VPVLFSTSRSHVSYCSNTRQCAVGFINMCRWDWTVRWRLLVFQNVMRFKTSDPCVFLCSSVAAKVSSQKSEKHDAKTKYLAGLIKQVQVTSQPRPFIYMHAMITCSNEAPSVKPPCSVINSERPCRAAGCSSHLTLTLLWWVFYVAPTERRNPSAFGIRYVCMALIALQVPVI